MRMTARMMAERKIILRSGKADGADASFQRGAQDYFNINNISHDCEYSPEIYIPWEGFKTSATLINSWDISEWPLECYELASKIHPCWERLSQGAMNLHARNICQVLGKDLSSPSSVVLYWTKGRDNEVFGGTSTAVNLARKYSIPTIKIGSESWVKKLRNIIGY